MRSRFFANVQTLAASVSLAALFISCTGVVDAGSGVEAVTVVPSTASVSVGSSLTLSADVRSAGGEVIADQGVVWSTADASIATVSQSGVVTGVRVGSVLIAASAWGRDAFARVAVNPTPVASVRLSLANRSLFVGEAFQLVAETLDGTAHVLPGRVITWSSSNESVATVTDAGVVTAIATGGAIITATSEGRSALASITVSAIPVASVIVTPTSSSVVVGQAAPLTADVRDASGRVLAGRVVTWTTSNALIATVTSQGVATAIAPGQATITATSEGKNASATIIVSPRPVSAVIVSPNQVTIFGGQVIQLSALVTDDRGQVLTGRPVSYSSSNSQVATVSASGLVTGISAGTATITATSESSVGTTIITVSPEPVVLVDLAPPSATVIVAQSVQLTATPRNASGQPLPLAGRTVAWTTSAPSIASVTTTGLVTGISPGSTIIGVTVDGKQASAVVNVRPVPVATVAVTPPSSSIVVGQTATLSATPRDANGNPLFGRVVAWSSSNNAVATVSSAGVVTGVANGAVTITATIEGQVGTAAVTVTIPIASVSISPTSATVNVAWTTTLVATARAANGTVVPGAPITWTSSDPTVATVSSGGVVTGIKAGSVTITARSGTASGTATVTVQLAPVDRIVVTPANPTINVNQTVQLTATLYDAQNNVLTGRTVTWSSSSTTRVTVTSTGVARGISSGTATVTASSGGKSGSTNVKVN